MCLLHEENTAQDEKVMSKCCVASKIFNEGVSTDYLNNVRGVNRIANENIFD